MYAKCLRTKLIIKIVPTIRAVGKSLYLKGQKAGSGLQRPPNLTNPYQKVARPRKIKMGMRHKVGMGMRKPEYAVKTT